MEVHRGSSAQSPRAASSERPGSRGSSASAPRVERRGPSSLTTRLDVLTNENGSPQVSAMSFNDENFFEDEPNTRESSPLQENTDKDAKGMPYIKHRDCKIQEAIDEMDRLDIILSAVLLEEKRVKLQGKEIQKQLWSELMSISRTYESHAEAANTRLFLALDAPHDLKAEVDSKPIFRTQPPDEVEIDIGYEEQSQKNMTHLPKAEGPPHLSPSAAPQGKRQKKKDFVKRNIELAGDTGGPFRMTPAEKERLAELLKGTDEEQDPAVGEPGDREGDACVSSFASSRAYTPEPAELERQRYIKYQLNLLGPLCPMEGYFSERNSCMNSSVSEGSGSDGVWGLGGETWASSRCAVGCETKEREGNASSPRDATAAEDAGLAVSPEIPRLSAEQLRALLEECEQSQRSHPRPPISKAKLAALLEDPYTTSFSHLGPFAGDD